MNDILNLDLHDRNLDAWYYKNVFSEDQLSFRENVINEIILERKFKESPNFSLRDIDYFSMVSKSYFDRIYHCSQVFLSNFYKGEYSHYDVKLINPVNRKFLDIKTFKSIINFLFETRYSEYMQYEIEEWVSILPEDKSLLLYLSVQKSDSSDDFYFRIGLLKFNSPNTAPPSTG